VAKKPRTPAPPRPVQAPKRREAPRKRPTIDRRLVAGGAGILVVLGVAIGLWLGLGGRGGGGGGAITVDFATLPGLQTKPPPWNNGTATLPDRLQPLGLSQLSAEGTVLHIHQHLDLYVDGKKVPVPAEIGIYANQWLTELHTHDTTGVIHVESPTQRNYDLGQFFGVWGLKLTPRCVGGACGKLTWWVNGQQQTGDPANLVLKSHQEIVLAVGTPPTAPPRSYKFPAGE
jgi:hypothetical protein